MRENYGFMEVIPASSIIIFANRFVIFATRWGDENPISHCVGTREGWGILGGIAGARLVWNIGIIVLMSTKISSFSILNHLGILTRPILWLSLLQNRRFYLNFCPFSSSSSVSTSSSVWQKKHYLHHVGVVLLGWGVAHHNCLLVTPLRLVVLVVAAEKCLKYWANVGLGWGGRAKLWVSKWFLFPLIKAPLAIWINLAKLHWTKKKWLFEILLNIKWSHGAIQRF